MGCQSLLSKQALGLRVINHGPSDSNPGALSVPPEMHGLQGFPPSIKGPNQFQQRPLIRFQPRSLETARGDAEKAFVRGRTQEAAGGSGALTLGGWACCWALALALLSGALSADGEPSKACSWSSASSGTSLETQQSRDEGGGGGADGLLRAWWAC